MGVPRARARIRTPIRQTLTLQMIIRLVPHLFRIPYSGSPYLRKEKSNTYREIIMRPKIAEYGIWHAVLFALRRYPYSDPPKCGGKRGTIEAATQREHFPYSNIATQRARKRDRTNRFTVRKPALSRQLSRKPASKRTSRIESGIPFRDASASLLGSVDEPRSLRAGRARSLAPLAGVAIRERAYLLKGIG